MTGAAGCRACIVLWPSLRITRFKVFSATVLTQREHLGEVVTAWLAAHTELSIVDITVVQSTEAGHHTLTFVISYHVPRASR